MRDVEVTQLAGDVRRSGTGHQQGPVPFGCGVERGDRRRATAPREYGVNLVLIKPLPRDAAGNIWLVLVVSGENFDWFPKNLAAKVRNRKLDGFDRAAACDIGINAVLIRHHANFDGVVGNLCGSARETCKQAN